MPTCLNCKAAYIAGTLYCDACGRRLPQPTGASLLGGNTLSEPSEQQHETARRGEGTPDRPLHLRLQLLQSGILFDLGTRASIVIGRKDPDQQPDVDLAPYGGVEQGVGRRHAIITLRQGRYYIEDLKSINETLLNASRLFPGQLYPLYDGDQLRFGAMAVKVLL